MLRITAHETPGCVTFQLEGKLAGSWVQELEDCWRRTRDIAPGSVMRLDLSEVSFVDAAGREFLAARHREGCELVAAGCMMRYIVDEIAGHKPRA
jgi:anti-anti-sigma regulatory factor